jgi:hypothetical protein
MAYSDKLKDPRWQKRRLEILERDGWACQICEDKEHTLHVHHKIYEQGKAPWEYDNDSLVTLCQNCHDDYLDEEKARSLIFKNIINMLKKYLFKDSRYGDIEWGLLNLECQYRYDGHENSPALYLKFIAAFLSRPDLREFILKQYKEFAENHEHYPGFCLDYDVDKIKLIKESQTT